LLAKRLQVVERVEQLFLGFILARDELDVVHEPHTDVALRLPELVDPVVLQSRYELFGKLLSGDIHQRIFGVLGEDLTGDTMQ